MRFLFILLLSGVQLFASYGYQRSITIDHSKVPNTDQSYFPVLVSGTYSYLATVANGGLVQHLDGSSNATDLVFTSDAGCSIILPFEIESYTASTGVIVYWVRIPVVSHTSDTVFYMCYGNAAITTTQAQPRAVWANNFAEVQHMGGNSTDSLTDSFGGNSGTDTSISYSTANGKIGQGAGLNGSSSFINDGSSGALEPNSTVWGGGLTVSAWIKGTAFSNAYNAIDSFNDGTNGRDFLVKSTGKLALYLGGGGGTNYDGTGSNTLSTGTWYYIALTYTTGNVLTGWVNGSSDHTANGTSPYGGCTSDNLYIGKAHAASRFFSGAMDEHRVARVARSGDWLTTEYNNQNSPSTFYTVAGSASTPTPYSFTNNRAVTLDHSKVPNTDQVNFPVLFSGTYAYLATVANGGQVQNSNGYDIAFATDSTCKNGYLPFEMDGYTASTGLVNFWINIPLLSHTVDTVIYLCYGSSAVSASLENKGLVWNSHYKGVWHHPDGSSLTLGDSTIYGTTGTNHSATATSGQIDGGAAFVQASTQYIDEGNANPINFTQCASGASCLFTFSAEAWVNFTGTFQNGVWPIIAGDLRSDALRGWNMGLEAADGAQPNKLFCQNNNGGLTSITTGGAISTSTWYHAVCMSGPLTMCVNGSCTAGAATVPRDDGQTGINVGRATGGATSGVGQANSYWDGKIDEFRLADVIWSTDWVTALYNTESNAFQTSSSPGPASTGARGFAYVQ